MTDVALMKLYCSLLFRRVLENFSGMIGTEVL